MEGFQGLVHLANTAEFIRVHSIITESHGTEPTDLKLVIEKNLTPSDLERKLGRLSIPQNQFLVDFLEPEERHNLENGGKISVTVIEPCLNVSELTFKKWKPFHVLIMGWNDLAHNEDNGLQVGDLIQLWSFRTGGSLGFAVVKA